MSRDIHRQAEKRLHAQADQAVEQFDSTLLHNRVHEQVAGQHSRAHPLAAWLDVTERAYDLAEREDIHDPAAEQAFSAGEVLTRGVGQLVADQVARACATIVLKAGDWTDTWSAGEIDAAQAEAERWLTEHRDAADKPARKQEGCSIVGAIHKSLLAVPWEMLSDNPVVMNQVSEPV